MSEVKIPEASLQRLKATYGAFEQLAVVVSEALGLGPDVRARLDMQRGVFVIEDAAEFAVPSPNGLVEAQP